ncbi:hypothetical protein H1S01_09380 [Heliobacterium chlorum]|uniref:Uncharacterized protein n=1 Tax=Heliobacterium chlorum TaxID=2698 RepID=A0ABR7T417_HELCL|nr:hypothetical protein [Heliobacterium chlorum]MBC9784720.1 hypothetical protein [Heliobacterium chlorum]
MKRFTARAFFDGMNRLLEKEAKEKLAQMEFRVIAELLPERMPIGQSCLWLVLDKEGRTMYWMVPENMASRCKPGMVVAAVGHPVLWPSSKQGKRLEWLQVKNLEPVTSGEVPRQEQVRQLAEEGFIGKRVKRDWPVDAEKGSVKIHLIAGEKNPFTLVLQHKFRKARRFQVHLHSADMNEPEQVARAILEASRQGGDFLLIIQHEEDNILTFDAPVLLSALKLADMYSLFVHPEAKIKPFSYWLIDEWIDSPLAAARLIVTRCWRTWKGPKEKHRLKEALVEQSHKDRARLVGDLHRLREENRDLEEKLLNCNPQKVQELERKLNHAEIELKRSEERRKVILNQLFGMEQEQEELKRKVALLEAGGITPQAPVDMAAEIEKIKRQESFHRMLAEEERDRLKEENQRLQARLDGTTPLLLEELKQNLSSLGQELERSEERREQLSEFLFILEQENQELKGRLGFREDLTSSEGHVQGVKREEEELIVGKARLYEEIHDVLLKEELEKLQREVKRLRELLRSCSHEMMVSLQDELAITRSQLDHSEALRDELRKEEELIRKELHHIRSHSEPQSKNPMDKLNEKRSVQNQFDKEVEQEEAEGNDSDMMDQLVGKTVEFFKHGFRWGKNARK